MKKTLLILTAAVMLSACGQVPASDNDAMILTPPTTEKPSSVQPSNDKERGDITDSSDSTAGREDVKGDGTDIDYSKTVHTFSEAGSSDSNGDVLDDVALMVSRREINAETDKGDEYCKRGEVIFKAEVPAECNPDIVLLKDAETGETLSEMRDIADFENYGDTLMGDGVYCCRYTFDLDFGEDPDVSAYMTCRFYAEFYDEHGTHCSNIVEVDLYEPFTDKELDMMEEVDDAISQLLQSEEYRQLPNPDKFDAVRKLLKDFAEKGYVKAESIYTSDDMVSFEYVCGGHVAIEVVSHHHDHEGDIIECN